MMFHRAMITLMNHSSGVVIGGSILTEIDHTLKWCEHISYVKNQVSKGLDIIFIARTVLDQKYLLTLYNSFVYPYLTYCIVIWGTASQIHIQPLFLAQKKVVRIITISHYLAHTQPLFQSLFILPVDKLILNQIGIFIYKYCNGLLPNVMNRLYVYVYSFT